MNTSVMAAVGGLLVAGTVAACGGGANTALQPHIGLASASASGGGSSSAAPAPSATPTTPTAPSAPIATASGSLSFYARQYLAIATPADTKLEKLNATTITTKAQEKTAYDEAATLVAGVDRQLAAASWPASVQPDITAEIAASQKTVSDYRNFATVSPATASRDANAAQTASNVVRSDLGLPAAGPSSDNPAT